MNIIFLDVDGVLNSMYLYEHVENIAEEPLDLNNIKCLKKVMNHRPGKIVLSSSWRGGWNKNPDLCDYQGIMLNEALHKYDLEIYDKTTSLMINDGTGRCHEIKAWMKHCPEKIEHILIIDDGNFHWSEHGLDPYWVQPNFMNRGFNEDYLQEAFRKYDLPYREKKWFPSRQILIRTLNFAKLLIKSFCKK